MYRGAMQAILSELVRQDRLLVVDSLELAEPKTKTFVDLLAGLGFDLEDHHGQDGPGIPAPGGHHERQQQDQARQDAKQSVAARVWFRRRCWHWPCWQWWRSCLA